MIHYIVVTLILALCLLIGLTRKTRLHTKHKPLRRWMRCALCGCYQNSTQNYCINHERPVLMLQASERQQRRINYHIGYLWQYPHLQRQQHAFVAFAMRLEDMTEDVWSTHAAISVYEQIGPRWLRKFVRFMLALEESVDRRFDVDDLINQFLISEEMEDDQAKVAQN